MATRSTISIENENGTVTTIYCHSDGYIGWTGVLLVNYYNTPEKVRKLIDLGDLSLLGENLTTDDAHTYYEPKDGVTVAYGRDRGEKHTEATVYESFPYAQKEVYNYLFRNGEWYFQEASYMLGHHKGLRLVKEDAEYEYNKERF